MSQAILTIKQTKEGLDIEAEDKDILSILDIFHKPNTTPSPRHYGDILDYLHYQYWDTGLSALVVRVTSDGKTVDFKQTIIPHSIKYDSYNNSFNCSFLNNQNTNKYSVFLYNADLKHPAQYTYQDAFSTYILIVNGNYCPIKRDYISPLNVKASEISIYNHTTEFCENYISSSFKPSGIITLSYAEGIPSNILRDTDSNEDIKKEIENFNNDIQGKGTDSKIIMFRSFNFKLDYKQISLPANANELTIYKQNSEEEIYNAFPNGSVSGFKGETQYAGNAVIHNQGIIFGALSIYNKYIVNMNVFFNIYLIGLGLQDLKNPYYLAFDTSNIRELKEHDESRMIRLSGAGFITANEGRAVLAKSDDFALLQPLPDGESLQSNNNGALPK